MAGRAGAVGLIAAVMVWSGCAESGRAGALVTDSAGVEVVTNTARRVDAAASWSLGPDPVVEIGGGASPEVPLFRVSDVAPLEGGGVAVATESPPQALVMGADGSLAATLGGAGGGPGEFTRVASVVPLGADSVAVWDPDRRRISVFSGTGELVREVNLSEVAPIGLMAAPNTETAAAWTHLMAGPGGSFVLFSVGAFGPGTGARRPEAPSYHLSADGEPLDTLGPFPGYESYAGPRTGVAPYPFGADTYGAMADGRLVVGTAESPELRYHDLEGRLRRIVRWPDHDRAVEGPLVEQWDSMLTGWLELMPERQRTMMREMFDRIPRPERFPAYDGVISGGDARVWVGEYVGMLEIASTPIDRRVPARQWLVFDGDGVLIATVETPAGFQPYAIASDPSAPRVWGVYRDELDVESVRAYGLVTAN